MSKVLIRNQQKQFDHTKILVSVKSWVVRLIHIDLLSKESDIGITSLLGTLLSLELKGAITQIGGKQFVVS